MAGLKRILLVEDKPEEVELMLTALDKNSLANEVVVVNDGAEALDYLYYRGKYSLRARNNPAVVLLDLKTPKVGGLEVLRTMKSDPGLKTFPVVVLTSSREEKDLVDSYEMGANAYVVKPVDFPQFIETVRQLGAFWTNINEPPPGTIREPRKLPPPRVRRDSEEEAKDEAHDAKLIQDMLAGE